MGKNNDTKNSSVVDVTPIVTEHQGNASVSPSERTPSEPRNYWAYVVNSSGVTDSQELSRGTTPGKPPRSVTPSLFGTRVARVRPRTWSSEDISPKTIRAIKRVRVASTVVLAEDEPDAFSEADNDAVSANVNATPDARRKSTSEAHVASEIEPISSVVFHVNGVGVIVSGPAPTESRKPSVRVGNDMAVDALFEEDSWTVEENAAKVSISPTVSDHVFLGNESVVHSTAVSDVQTVVPGDST